MAGGAQDGGLPHRGKNFWFLLRVLGGGSYPGCLARPARSGSRVSWNAAAVKCLFICKYLRSLLMCAGVSRACCELRAASAAFREPPAHFNVCQILPQCSGAFEEELLLFKLLAVKLSACVPPRVTGPERHMSTCLHRSGCVRAAQTAPGAPPAPPD